jgi:hypothetical protein
VRWETIQLLVYYWLQWDGSCWKKECEERRILGLILAVIDPVFFLSLELLFRYCF